MNFYGRYFRTIRKLTSVFFPPQTLHPYECEEGVVYIAHHQNMQGPILTMLWYPQPLHAWSFYVFCDKKTCYKQLTGYTFTKRFHMPKILAVAAAWLVSCLFPPLLISSGAIPVYRGSLALRDTLKRSLDVLRRGENIIIFPDVDYANTSSTTGQIYNGFLHLEQMYYNQTGKHLRFIPLCADKKSRSILTGAPIEFTGDVPFRQEREIVAQKLIQSINALSAADSFQSSPQ